LPPPAGVAGLSVAALGAHVTLTDLGRALPLTQQNAAANEEVVRRAGGYVRVLELDWASPCGQVLGEPWDVVMGEWQRGRMWARVAAGTVRMLSERVAQPARLSPRAAPPEPLGHCCVVLLARTVVNTVAAA
jgi:hypothetical protein